MESEGEIKAFRGYVGSCAVREGAVRRQGPQWLSD